MAQPFTIVLKPNNEIETMKVDSQWWTWLLDAGPGLPIAAGKGVGPNNHIVKPRGDANPYLGTGFEVTETEAEAMALCAGGLVIIEDAIFKSWSATAKENEQTRQIQALLGAGRYRQPKTEEERKLIRTFAEFSALSGGFVVLSEKS